MTISQYGFRYGVAYPAAGETHFSRVYRFKCEKRHSYFIDYNTVILDPEELDANRELQRTIG